MMNVDKNKRIDSKENENESKYILMEVGMDLSDLELDNVSSKEIEKDKSRG